MSRPLHNPLRDLVGYQLRRASAAAMEELARELGEIGLRPIEASVLLLVGANPMIKPIEVGRELGVQRPNMSPLVAGLEGRGLVAREAVDGRSQGLSLTPSGVAARDRAHAIMQAHDARLLSRLSGSGAGGGSRDLVGPLFRLWSEAPDAERSSPDPKAAAD